MSLSKEEKLAQELADTLDDQAGYAFFLICTEKYAESHISSDSMKEDIILGINPGTCVLGYAIAENDQITECGIKPFMAKWSKEKLKYILRTIEGLCEYHQVKVIALKRVDPLRCSKELETLVLSILLMAQKKKILVRWYSLPILERYCQKAEKNGRESIADYTLSLRPDLKREYLKEYRRKHKYYAKMFEAIVAAHIEARMRMVRLRQS